MVFHLLINRNVMYNSARGIVLYHEKRRRSLMKPYFPTPNSFQRFSFHASILCARIVFLRIPDFVVRNFPWCFGDGDESSA